MWDPWVRPSVCPELAYSDCNFIMGWQIKKILLNNWVSFAEIILIPEKVTVVRLRVYICLVKTLNTPGLDKLSKMLAQMVTSMRQRVARKNHIHTVKGVVRLVVNDWNKSHTSNLVKFVFVWTLLSSQWVSGFENNNNSCEHWWERMVHRKNNIYAVKGVVTDL